MAKEKFILSEEDKQESLNQWENNRRPMSNDELKEYLKNEYGDAIRKGIKRWDYSCIVDIKTEGGEYQELIISLPSVAV